MAKRWYVIHTYSGYEATVKANLEERIQMAGLGDLFEEILIPTERVQEVRRGVKHEMDRKFLPGYILIKMEEIDDSDPMTTQAWLLVKNTPKVTGFVSSGKPSPLADSEVEGIHRKIEEGKAKPKPKVRFQKGERVRVIDGPFANFVGVVEDINPDKSTLRIMVSIFGRSTPVELEFLQVESA